VYLLVTYILGFRTRFLGSEAVPSILNVRYGCRWLLRADDAAFNGESGDATAAMMLTPFVAITIIATAFSYVSCRQQAAGSNLKVHRRLRSG